MSHFDESGVAGLTDRELNAELARMLNLKTLPALHKVLDRLRADGIESHVDVFDVPDNSQPQYRVCIKPPAWAVSVTSSLQTRSLRIALLIWLRYDGQATELVRKALRVSEK
jgi:hypothetical protein